MDTNRLPDMIMMSLVNTHAEVLALKDFIIEDFIVRNKIDDETAKKIIVNHQEAVKIYQTNLIAQLRAKYDTNLGSIDDLLNDLEE